MLSPYFLESQRDTLIETVMTLCSRVSSAELRTGNAGCQNLEIPTGS